MVECHGSIPTSSPPQARVPRRQGSDTMRILSAALAAFAVATVMVAIGSVNPQAEELLSSHHLRKAILVEKSIAASDDESLSELSRLAAAADSQAKTASSLKQQEGNKIKQTPSSKVDAETMLANEAKKKSAELFGKVLSIKEKLTKLTKKLRKQHHKARHEKRMLKEDKQGNRDDQIALHDREMKVLEARHDVQNAAKAGHVTLLREAQDRLNARKEIAKGARAQVERDTKKLDQVAAKARLLQKRAKLTSKKMHELKAERHNDRLMAKEELAASRAIGARANFLRDKAALSAARGKYKSLAELLADKTTDHTQVEETLSKIAANIHTWRELKDADEKAMAQKAKLYKEAQRNVAKKSIALAAQGGALSQSLLETGFGGDNSWARPVELQQVAQQYAPAAQPMAYAMPAQQVPQQYAQQQFAQQQYAQQQYAQQPMIQQPVQQQLQQPVATAPAQPAAAAAVSAPAPAPAPAVVEQTGQAEEAPAANSGVLPGAVGNIPYVYNNKQYLPKKAQTTGFPIVWVFADNKTHDTLYFGYQSADGTMHVYNKIKPNSVTRQQAFGNEYWTILAADKKTVVVQPFKITQDNQWLSIAGSQ